MNGTKIVVYDAINDGSGLGKYKTEERTKEVLQEIINKYSEYIEVKGGVQLSRGSMPTQPSIFNIPKIYRMPEE